MPTVTYLKHDAKAKKRAENIEKNDPELWRIILAERVRVSEQEIEAAKNRSWEGAQDRDLDEIGLGHVTNAFSERQGQSVFPMLDEADNEDDGGESDKLFESIFCKCTDQQQQSVRENRLDDALWQSFTPQTRQLIIDKSFDNLSRYGVEPDLRMSLTLVNSLQNLPSAKEEKGTGWYIGVVSDMSDPVDEDYSMWGNHTSFGCALHDTCETGIRKTASTIGRPAELISPYATSRLD